MESELEVFVSECRGGEYITQYNIHIKDPVYGFSTLYKGQGTLQENKKKAIAEMRKEIEKFEAEAFEAKNFDLEKSVSSDTSRLYDYINNRTQGQEQFADN